MNAKKIIATFLSFAMMVAAVPAATVLAAEPDNADEPAIVAEAEENADEETEAPEATEASEATESSETSATETAAEEIESHANTKSYDSLAPEDDTKTPHKITVISEGGVQLTVQSSAVKGERVRVDYKLLGNYDLISLDIKDDQFGGDWSSSYDAGEDCYFFEMPWYDVTIRPHMTGDMEFVEIPVTAEWLNSDFPFGAKVEAKLYADGCATGKKITLERGNTEGSFDALPKFVKGVEVEYTVEAEVKGSGDYRAEIEGDVNNGFEISCVELGVVDKRVTYVGETGRVLKHEAVVLTGYEETIAPGWYVVKSNITFKNGLKVSGQGDVVIILSDGKTAKFGDRQNALNGCAIENQSGGLSIYGQTNGNGSLVTYTDGTNCFDTSVDLAGAFTMYGGNMDIHAGDLGLKYSEEGFKMYAGSLTINAKSTGIIGEGEIDFLGGQLDVTGGLCGILTYDKDLRINSTSDTDMFKVNTLHLWKTRINGAGSVIFGYEYRDESGKKFFDEVDYKDIEGQTLRPVRYSAITWEDLRNVIESGKYTSFTLHNNIIGTGMDAEPIRLPEGRKFTLNLNGYKIETNRTGFDIQGHLEVNGGDEPYHVGRIEGYNPEQLFNLSSPSASLRIHSVRCTTHDGRGKVINTVKNAKIVLDGEIDFNAPVYLAKNTVITIGKEFFAQRRIPVAMEKNGVFTEGLKGHGSINSFRPADENLCVYQVKNEEAALSNGAEISGYSATIDGTFRIRVYMLMPEAARTDKDATMTFTMPLRTFHIKLDDAFRQVIDGNEYYVFELAITSKEFYDLVEPTLRYGSTAQQLKAFTFSDYMNALGDKYRDFVEAMEYYATTTCYYFDHYYYLSNPDDSAHFYGRFMEGLKSKFSKVDTSSIKKDYDIGNLPDGVTFAGSSLICKTTTTLRLFFESDAQIDAFAKGMDVSVTRSGKYQIVAVEGFAPADLDKNIDVFVNGSKITVSPATFCLKVLGSEKESEVSKALAMSVLLYNSEANKLF